MSLKRWLLELVQRLGGLLARHDLPPPEAASAAAAREAASDALPAGVEHLGPYGELIGAIREELEHFAASHVRLHLAIAERDRFLLTSIGVRCMDQGEAQQLLQRFLREFKPEQVKRYLAREVIGALPNAAAIELSQFAGLHDADAQPAADEAQSEYAELLAMLRGGPRAPGEHPYQVSIVGRWTEAESAAPAVAPAATSSTPLAGPRLQLDIEDARGHRQAVLSAVTPGRRYVLGKGENCDVVLSGAYTSRRHCELWLQDGSWWVADAGSTNGIRVELPAGVVGRSGAHAGAPGSDGPIEVPPGARIVLSAQAEGDAREHPRVVLHPTGGALRTPIAPAAGTAAPATPITPVAAARAPWMLTAHTAAGPRTLEFGAQSLPLTVGRSRSQSLVIAQAHAGVSGHHLTITQVDASGAEVQVAGDNGVRLAGRTHAAGTRLRWPLGETLVLGSAGAQEPACTLLLQRRGDSVPRSRP